MWDGEEGGVKNEWGKRVPPSAPERGRTNKKTAVATSRAGKSYRMSTLQPVGANRLARAAEFDSLVL